ncbi:serine hydrolase [Chitinophaga rhizophila]|uniref:Class A beta-lactamase-related serine hydrolase n=1 Tax=Chitinophaga rhizophila TaxID=2866212 RepID=A0ABS7GAX1_9BACT|nr:serine hydrolase [Chitinophaga rhizophila]MBW8684813.1 class A beta-lactamase-related serine hydrolase [Chitinophaga rhizophila]
MIRYLLLLLFLPALAFSQQDHKLEKGLQEIITGFQGDVGIYVSNLKTGRYAAINADSVFPTASIIKIPILVGVFDKIEKGELQYHQPLVYRDSIKYGGAGLMQFFKDSTVTELSVLVALMMSYSDNTTSLWNQALAGGGQRINELMQQYGLQVTRVNSRTPGREQMREVYGWGMTTPREMAELLVKIRQGAIISENASSRMYRLMTHGYYDEGGLSQIPPYIQAAHKSGSVDASRSEVILVHAPHGEYVFYAGTKNNKDQRWTNENEAEQLIRKIAAYLWDYFEHPQKKKKKA